MHINSKVRLIIEDYWNLIWMKNLYKLYKTRVLKIKSIKEISDLKKENIISEFKYLIKRLNNWKITRIRAILNIKEELMHRDWYITWVDRTDWGEKRVTHLYKWTFQDPWLPMCKRGRNRVDSYSIFRNNISKKWICKICEKRAKKDLDWITL